MIERSGAIFRIDRTNIRDGFVDRLTGDKTGSQFFEKSETGGEIL
jgi:hypothetical protein